VTAPRVHHLDCGTMCPRGKRLLDGPDGAHLVCHVLLIEGADGLVLVDTGFGTGDVTDPGRLRRPFNALIRPRLEVAATAVSQLVGLGFEPGDVRDIVLTHIDPDHAGGLPDFPAAAVHLFAGELEAWMRPNLRERPRRVAAHWEHGPRWAPHDIDGDRWFGFEAVRALPVRGAEILLIPLPGHTRGHTAVALRREQGWLLHCGDAYFHRGEVEIPPSCPPWLRAFQTLTQASAKLRRQNQERLRELAQRHCGEVELICSHDPVELDRHCRADARI
jgi:glyoxylase-like metal-dependent hydrolase (beta-lactamase superfamily II)